MNYFWTYLKERWGKKFLIPLIICSTLLSVSFFAWSAWQALETYRETIRHMDNTIKHLKTSVALMEEAKQKALAEKNACYGLFYKESIRPVSKQQ
jgi:hypothetical protein